MIRANEKNCFSSGVETLTTCGQYENEVTACQAFDAAIERTGLFNIYREVAGQYLFTPPFKDAKPGARIDRILVLKTDINGVYPFGAIGVEIKKSGEKIGKVLSQMLDYHRCAFDLNKSIPVSVVLKHVFLWPCEKTHNEVASIMGQNRIGTVNLRYDEWSPYHGLYFFSGEHKFLTYYFNGSPNGNHAELGSKFGKRQGSR